MFLDVWQQIPNMQPFYHRYAELRCPRGGGGTTYPKIISGVQMTKYPPWDKLLQDYVSHDNTHA